MTTRIVSSAGSAKFKLTYPENMFDSPIIIEEIENPKNKIIIPIDSFGSLILELHAIYKNISRKN